MSKLKNLLILVATVVTLNFTSILYSHSWQDVELKTQNTVVQVWAHYAKFNWLEPYKAPEQYMATGTAFFINSAGDLLTNFHVINEAKSLFINIPSLGRKPLEVVVKGVCPERDVALLKLTDKSYEEIKNVIGDIPFLELGDSDSLYRTEPVLALGYPLSQRYLKSTIGVVAGREYIDNTSFIHITAPINPGNSGGPLLNILGQVVGINTAMVTKAQNVGYIIPINDVKIMLEALYELPLYRKPQIGIKLNPATDEHCQKLGNPVPGGAYINRVQKGSLAEKVGIEVGDMLYEIKWRGTSYDVDEYGDIKVEWSGIDKISLGELLVRFELKEPVVLAVYRNGQRLEKEFNFDWVPKYPMRYIYPDYEPNEIDYETFGGLVVMQLRENHANLLPESFLLKKCSGPDISSKEALIVTSIMPGSQMHKVYCFYPGVMLKKVNGQKVKNLTELREALLKSADSKDIAIETKDNYSTVVSLDKVLGEEIKLSQSFRFPISETVSKLFETYKAS